MRRYTRILYFLCLSLFLSLPLASMAQESEGRIIDPLTLSGEVGTQVVSSWNSVDKFYNTPFSATAYANMTMNVYGISIPMSLNFINTNAKQFAFSKPNFTMSFRPMWKKFTLYLGTNSLNFSNYTYNGISFNGVGLEYRGRMFRFGGFYGIFNRATTFNAKLDDRDAVQYLSDELLGLNNVAYTTIPQFQRKAYAGHIAVGTVKNYVDISLLHAADDLNSLPAEWYMYDSYDTTLYSRDSVRGKENLAMGLKGHFTIGKHVMFETNLGASLFTPDISRDELSLEGEAEAANKIINGVRKTGLFNLRYGSEIRFAGDALLNLKFNPVNATFTYRFVQPNYVSLGTSGFNPNTKTFGSNIFTSLFHNTASLSLNGYLQRDNLDQKQKYTNQVLSYSAKWNNTFGGYLDLGITYSGVLQKQFDGLLVVDEDTRINHITHSLDVTPSYTLSLKDDHTFSLNYSLLQNKNLNQLMESMRYFDATTHSFGVGYEVYLSGPRLSIDANYDYSLSSSVGSANKSHDFACGTKYNFIEKDQLTLSGNARLVLAFNVQEEEEELTDAERKTLDYLARRVGKEATTEITNDLSVAARLGASLNYKDRHKASMYFTVSNYSDNIIIGQHVAVKTDVRFMLEYSYSFASRLIKSKKRS